MHEEKQSLGSQLRDIRSLRKLSLRDVEQATGISNAYLSQLENDKISKPSPHFLHKLSKVYNIDYEMLMEAAGYAQSVSREAGPKTLRGAALFSEQNLTPEEEERLVELLQMLRARKR